MSPKLLKLIAKLTECRNFLPERDSQTIQLFQCINKLLKSTSIIKQHDEISWSEETLIKGPLSIYHFDHDQKEALRKKTSLK